MTIWWLVLARSSRPAASVVREHEISPVGRMLRHRRVEDNPLPTRFFRRLRASSRVPLLTICVMTRLPSGMISTARKLMIPVRQIA